VLMRPRRNANGPADAKVIEDLLRLKVVVQDLVPDVGAVGDPDITLPVHLKPVRQVELTGFFAGLLATHLSEELSVLIKLHNAVVAVSIGYENVALRIPTHVRRPAKNVFLRRRIWAGGRRHGT